VGFAAGRNGDISTSHVDSAIIPPISGQSRQTVQPGQVVTSGSYPGGSAMDLGRSLKPGDLVELRIDRLGSLLNQIAPA